LSEGNGAYADRWEQAMTIQAMWNVLLEMGVEEQTLNIITDINGYNEETLQDVLYAYAGYRDFDQL